MSGHKDKQFFGNDWKAEASFYPSVLKEVKRTEIANITITCTDNIKSRLDLWNVLAKVPSSSYTDNNTPLYWMDFGNTKTAGQVVLGTVPKKIKQPVSTMYETVGSLKVITRFVKYARVKEVDSDRVAHWQRHWKNRICLSTPRWRNSAAISSGKCSATG